MCQVKIYESLLSKFLLDIFLKNCSNLLLLNDTYRGTTRHYICSDPLDSLLLSFLKLLLVSHEKQKPIESPKIFFFSLLLLCTYPLSNAIFQPCCGVVFKRIPDSKLRQCPFFTEICTSSSVILVLRHSTKLSRYLWEIYCLSHAGPRMIAYLTVKDLNGVSHVKLCLEMFFLFLVMHKIHFGLKVSYKV